MPDGELFRSSRDTEIPDYIPRRDPKGLMAEDQLKDIIRRELNQALGTENGKLSNERMEAMKYYQGGEFAEPPPGQNRSRVVMLTVLETVEWVLPALLRIFCASPQIADINPVKQTLTPPPPVPGAPPPMDPEEAGRQASNYVNHIFNEDNPGFLILHDWFKDALLAKLGWVKRWWDESEIRETNTFTGLTQEEYSAKINSLDDPNGSSKVEILEEKSYDAPTPSGMSEDAPQPIPPMPPGAPQPRPKLYDCKLRVTKKEGRIRVANVPPEEVLFSRRCTRNYYPFICHRQPLSMTQLVEMGYDKDCIEQVAWSDTEDYNAERLQRYKPDDDFPYTNDRTDAPMRNYWFEENYIMVDYDGDGIAELCKIGTVNRAATILTKGGKLDIEEVDEVPLHHLCPVPMPHKLVGMSVADLVMDLQRIKSTLVRQMLDNIYLTNNPRHLVVESSATDETYDDLLTSKPGGLVRTRSPDGVQPLITPFVAEKAQGLVEYIDQTAEIRTGISRRNQGLDPDDLNRTATGINLIQQAAAQRVELIARIFAFGVQELIKGILGLVKKHQQEERIIRVTGSYMQIDPAQWKNDMTVSVSVGLGTGNRDQMLQYLMQLLNVQQQIVMAQGGSLQGPLVYGKNVYDLVTRLQQNAGFKESFITDPTVPPPPSVTGPPQPPKPDPAAQQAQAEIQIAQQKAQAEQQLSQQKAQQQATLAQQKAQADMAIDHNRAQNDMALASQKQSHEMQLAQQKMENDMQVQRMQAAANIEIERIKADNAHALAMHQANLQAQQPQGNGG